MGSLREDGSGLELATEAGPDSSSLVATHPERHVRRINGSQVI
jgi:hypothetical protein